MSYASTRYPDLFDPEDDDLRNDPDYQKWADQRESEFLDDFRSDAMLRNINATFDMLDRAMAKRS